LGGNQNDFTFAFIWPFQESIIKQVNGDPKAGWEAAMNPQFSNYTVSLQVKIAFYD
jgi:hypothetical protein